MQNKKISSRRLVSSIILVLMLIVTGSCGRKGPLLIAIQPIGDISAGQIAVVRVALDSIHKGRVIVLKTIPAPEEAFVNIKSPRYRADKLLKILRAAKPDSVDYVMGLTAYDISTTKHDKWG